jgi:ATP-binding cassette subfamily B protein
MLLVLYPLFTWMTVRSSGKWQAWQKQKNEEIDIASGRFAESINQVKVVKSFRQEERELSFFKKHYGEVIRITKPQSAYWHKQDIRRRLLLNVIFFAVYIFIFVRGAQGVFTPGQAVALILFAMNIRIPIFTISFLVENTQRAISDSKDYFDVMALAKEKGDDTQSSLAVRKGAIQFRDVHFSYGEDAEVARGISFTIEPKTKIALVGESGEGKTTLTNLLLRLYVPNKGSILIDGHNIQEVSLASLRSQIGVVFQEPALFSGTIQENISYARPEATREEVVAAAKAANAHEFISKLEHGYDSEIGERGLKLSGGQKQRIAIARALLKDAPILILDEATSSLDSKSEALVQEALETLMKDRSTIIIAHRLSTIQYVDKIITLRSGKVGEIGSPAELARSGGIYAELLKLQKGDTDASRKKLQKYDIAA